MALDRLRLHHILPASRANGPGLRAVLWTQGCTLGCPGCFNPETHVPTGGMLMDVDAVVAAIRKIAGQNPIEGITISGGEPLQQIRPLARFLARLSAQLEPRLSVVLFSGYTWDEIQRMPAAPSLLAHVDLLIAGRYDQSHRVASALTGSANKTLHFLTSRYSPADLAGVGEAEVIISPTGEITLSGIDPLRWQQGG